LVFGMAFTPSVQRSVGPFRYNWRTGMLSRENTSEAGTPPAATEQMRFSRRQQAIVTLLFAVALLNYIDRQVLSVLVPVMKDQIGLTTEQYAWLVNAFLFAYGIMYTGSGLVLDRVGARLGLAFFVLVWSVVSGLHAAAGGFAGLLVLRFLLGLSEPGGWTGAIKTISERFNPVQRGLAAGIFASGASVATLIAPPLVVFMSLHWGWRMAFVIPALAGLLWLPFWWRATRKTAEDALEPAAVVVRPGFRATVNLVRERQVLGYVLARFFGDSSGYFLLFWIPEYLSTMKGFSFAMLGTLGWFPFLCNDVGPLTGGYVSSKLVQAGIPPVTARKIVMSVAPLLVAVGALSVSATNTWIILAELGVAAFGVGVWAGNLHALPADAFPQVKVATVYGLAGSAGAIGGIIFNYLVGYFTVRSNYAAIFAMLLLLQPLGAAAMWLFLKPRTDIHTPVAAGR
jgi:ACS family hexuronate transporter-like MFS transporter